MEPKESRGRSESPLDAPAGAKSSVPARRYRMTCKKDETEDFANKRIRHLPTHTGKGRLQTAAKNLLFDDEAGIREFPVP